MKEFKIPQKLTDLENSSEDTFTIEEAIELGSYNPSDCMSLLYSKMSLI